MMHGKRADFQARRRQSLQKVALTAGLDLEPTANGTPTEAAPVIGEYAAAMTLRAGFLKAPSPYPTQPPPLTCVSTPPLCDPLLPLSVLLFIF